jgi:hypothetical protein
MKARYLVLRAHLKDRHAQAVHYGSLPVSIWDALAHPAGPGLPAFLHRVHCPGHSPGLWELGRQVPAIQGCRRLFLLHQELTLFCLLIINYFAFYWFFFVVFFRLLV